MELAPGIDHPEPATTGNDGFQLLHTGEEGLSQMLEEVQGAQVSVRIETYIFHAGPLAEQFREALVLACRRGVQVRVLVDALGSISLPTAFWDPLVETGGSFAWFNPIKRKRWSYRDHRKLLIVDDRVAFVGGFNIADEYKGDGVTYGWRDLGLRVSGPVVAELARSFDLFFDRSQIKGRLLQRLRAVANKIIEGPYWQVVQTGPGLQHSLRQFLGRDLAEARVVRVISAYFLPAWRLRKQLRRVCKRGGRVQLILAGKSDVALSQLASRRLYGMLMRSGVEIYEYQPQILHAKLFIFDDTVYVGSANFDVRSLRINYELTIRLNDAKLASEAAAMFDNDLQHCRRIDPHTWRSSRNLWAKIKESWAYFVLAKLDPYLAGRQVRIFR